MARKVKHQGMPQVTELYKPVLKALVNLGGSANIDELNEQVYKLIQLPNELINIPRKQDGRTVIEYRLAWTRSLLKKYGLLDNSDRGIWSLTTQKINPDKINPNDIDKSVRRLKSRAKEKENEESIESEIEIVDWKKPLLEKLFSISPSAFERLAQRVLRENGFTQVEVTGKTGDGGIDGKGIVRLNGFLSFHVIFQCKRYKNSVGPSQIRDFRGAMQGRADKGLFITTGTFTRDAIKEATRDGAPPIDLIDGDLLCEKLKELKLGVTVELVEMIKVKTDWFDSL